MAAKMFISQDELGEQECTDYQPIQTQGNYSLDDLETTEETGCDSCLRYNKGQCEIYEKC